MTPASLPLAELEALTHSMDTAIVPIWSISSTHCSFHRVTKRGGLVALGVAGHGPDRGSLTWHERCLKMDSYSLFTMRPLALALLGLFAVSAVAQSPAVDNTGAGGNPAEVLKALRDKTRNTLIGKWMTADGGIVEFTVSGAFSLSATPFKPLAPNVPRVISGTYVLTETMGLKLIMENREPMTTEFTSVADRLTLKSPKGNWVDYIRLDKKGIASITLNELRQLDAFTDIWAIEENKRAGDRPTVADLLKHTKKGTRLHYAMSDPTGPKDLMGNPYGPFIVDTLPKVNPATFKALADVAPREFWEKYIE